VHYIVVIAIIGFAAQLIDGALGMAYGATSATLLGTGASPAVASATVHLAEVGTKYVYATLAAMTLLAAAAVLARRVRTAAA
jgi:uncharacterized membrane protein YfcA